MRWWPILLFLAACNQDETVSGYLGDTTGPFELISINKAPFDASATLDLTEQGRISGSAPCNTYFADQTAPYPWFAIGPIGATRRACQDLQQEGEFFDALSRMTIAEVSGNILILKNTEDEEMVFQAP